MIALFAPLLLAFCPAAPVLQGEVPAAAPLVLTVSTESGLGAEAQAVPGIRFGIWTAEMGPLEPPLITGTTDESGRAVIEVPAECGTPAGQNTPAMHVSVWTEGRMRLPAVWGSARTFDPAAPHARLEVRDGVTRCLLVVDGDGKACLPSVAPFHPEGGMDGGVFWPEKRTDSWGPGWLVLHAEKGESVSYLLWSEGIGSAVCGEVSFDLDTVGQGLQSQLSGGSRPQLAAHESLRADARSRYLKLERIFDGNPDPFSMADLFGAGLPFAELISKAPGLWDVGGLAPGRYRVFTYEADPFELELKPSEEGEGIPIPLQPTITVQCFDREGKPWQGLLDWGPLRSFVPTQRGPGLGRPMLRFARVDPDCPKELWLPMWNGELQRFHESREFPVEEPGTWVVGILGGEFGYQVQTVMLDDWGDAAVVRFDMPPDGLPPTGHLEIRVANDQEPAFYNNLEFSVRSLTDRLPFNRFEHERNGPWVADLPAGRWEITAREGFEYLPCAVGPAPPRS
ncbi:MAG: hypothetical protein R3E96_11340 [Planctomycetota bacterium]